MSHKSKQMTNTVMSLSDAPSLIEAPPKVSANCHTLVAPPKNRRAPVTVLAPGASNTNFKESIHKYSSNMTCWQPRKPGLLMMAWGRDCSFGFVDHRRCLTNHATVTLYSTLVTRKMAQNRSALDSVLAPGASNRDNTVNKPKSNTRAYIIQQTQCVILGFPNNPSNAETHISNDVFIIVHVCPWSHGCRHRCRVMYKILWRLVYHCPACRTTLIATRFWVVMICPIIKCLTVLEFSFILFDLCLFITIFNFILNYVPIVTFWIFTYHKIWILLIIFCFIWSYWIVYFLTCLEVFWSVVS